jgi:DNA primase catalytic core
LKKLANAAAAKEYLRERVDILQLIKDDLGDDREWKLEGSDTWVTTSPFREEHTPSFKVSLRTKKFRDWGGEQLSGDMFAWVMINRGCRFEEAVLTIAEKAKVDITQFLRDPTPEELQQSRYKQINTLAADFMQQLLKDNQIIRENYLSRSGFTWDMIEPYQVGYCPSNETLISYISSKIRLTEDDVYKLEFNRTDLFTDALIYPIHNHSGEVIHFRGRKLNPSDSPYIGVRTAHPLYDPSVLYGFHVARKNLRNTNGKLVIVEGHRDAIALGAVAVMGSELRDKQIEELKRYKITQLTICYDGDETGWKKTLKMISDPQDFGSIMILVARPDTDKDPHDIWRDSGGEGVYRMLSKAVLPIEYYITSTFGAPGTLDLTNKHKLLAGLKDYLNQITGAHLDMAAAYLAKMIESTQESVLDYVSEIKASYSQLFNLEAERTLIYFAASNSVSYNAAISAGIRKDAFTLSGYQKIFESCSIAYNKFAETYTSQAVLDEAMAKFMAPELPKIMAAVLDGNYKYTEPAACDIVLDMWRRRKASEQANRLTTAARDLSVSFVEVVNEHRRILIDTTSGSRPQARTPRELADEFWATFKDRQQKGGNLIIGHDYFGFPSINLVLGGIQPGHMTTIAGDTGAGKSAFGINILKCIGIDGGKDGPVPCLWIGQEMQSVENTQRLASIMTGIHNTRVQSGGVSQREAAELAKAVEKISRSGYHFAKPVAGTIDEIVALIDEYRFKYGVKVVFWDYIQMVAQAEWQFRVSREQIIGHASKTMKNRVAEDMGLAVIVIAQQNRDTEGNKKSTQRVGGSYQISQDSDNFIEIVNKSKKQIQEDGIHNGNRYVRVGKRRGGISDVQLNAYLDTDERTASLQLKDCSLPSEISALYTRLAA